MAKETTITPEELEQILKTLKSIYFGQLIIDIRYGQIKLMTKTQTFVYNSKPDETTEE